MKQIITKKVTRSTLIGVVLLLSACVNTLELTSPYKNGNVNNLEQAAEGAKLYFGSHQELLTRSAEAPLNEDAPFVVGNIVPDWNSAVSIANNEKQYTDFTMRKDFDFYWLPNDNVEQRVKLYSRFASVEEFALDTINQYIATYIPDTEYLLSYPAVAQDYGINCAEWYEFSGTVLYTTISGHVVAVAHYTKGKSTKRAFLYDREKTAEENLLDFYAIMEGTVLGIGLAQQETRVVTDNEDNPIVIQEIIITAKKPFRPTLMSEEYPNTMVNPSDITPTIIIDLGGGGESTNKFTKEGEDDDEEEKPTGKEMLEDLFDTSSLSEEDKEIVGKMLEDIIKDCMGEELYKQLLAKYNKSGDTITLIYSPSTQEDSNFNFYTNFNSNNNIPDQTILNLFDSTSDVLLHEMFHAYQLISGMTGENFCSATVNYEIEAQLAKYFYGLRNKEIISLEDAHNLYNTEGHPWFHIANLSTSIQMGTTERSIVNTKQYAKEYRNAVQIYINKKGDIKYTYAIPNNIEDTIKNLTLLSINCQ